MRSGKNAGNSSNGQEFFGVSITLAQRLLYKVDEASKERSTLKFTAFGFYDYVGLKVVDNLDAFSYSTMAKRPLEDSKARRESWHPDVHKIFLWDEGDEKRKKSLMKYDSSYNHNEEKDKPLPFFAITTVKFQHHFIEVESECKLCVHIERYLKKVAGGQEIDVFVLRALSVDDVCVFIAAKCPSTILECVVKLDDFHCKMYGCKYLNNEEKNNFYDGVKEETKKRFKAGISRDKEEYECGCIANCVDSESKCDDRGKFERTITIIEEKANSYLKQIENLNKEEYNYYEELGKIINNIKKESYNISEGAEKDKVFEYNYLYRRLCNALLPLLPSFPVATTHTIIGWNTNGAVDSGTERAVEVVFKVRLCPAFSPVEFIDKFHEKVNGESDRSVKEAILDGDNHFLVGGYDVLQNLKLKPNQLIQLHKISKKMWEEGVVEHSSIEFLSEIENIRNNRILDEKLKKIKVSLENFGEKETMMAKSWVEKHQARAHDFFNEYGIKYKEEFKWLHLEIKEFSLLYTQAMNKFFLALKWSEFKTSRRFWERFFRKLEREFKHLESSECEDRENYALMIYRSMYLFSKAMEDTFKNCIILDMSMRTNTSSDIYATGAYEDLLRGYRILIRKIISVCYKVAGEEDSKKYKFFFSLCPTRDTAEQYMIYSDFLFPMSKTKGLAIIFYQHFDRMLDIKSSLALWTHECGHYISIPKSNGNSDGVKVNISKRNKVFLGLVSVGFSRRLASELNNVTFSKIPLNAIKDYIDRIAINMNKYLISCYEGEEKNLKYLSILKGNIIKWVEVVFKGFESLNTGGMSAEGKQFVTSLVELYDVLNATEMIVKDGKFAANFLREVLLEKSTILENCISIVKEVCADMMMIYLLDLKEEDYFDVFLKAIEARDSKSGLKAKKDEEELDAIRVSAAISMIRYRETFAGIKENELSDLKEEVCLPIIKKEVELWLSENTKILDERKKEDVKKLLTFYKKGRYLMKELFEQFLTNYLFEANKDIYLSINQLEEDEELKVIRNTYRNINNTDNFANLRCFLELRE